jgi:hypothetical protein
MSTGPRLLLTGLVLGAVASFAGIGLTVAWNWFFRGELGMSQGTLVRLVILGFVIGTMPLGLAWARSRKP